jgi:hypothetical protein
MCVIPANNLTFCVIITMCGGVESASCIGGSDERIAVFFDLGEKRLKIGRARVQILTKRLTNF